MKRTLKGRNEYVSLSDLTADQIADALTMLGLEVDAVADMSQGLVGIKTARITRVKKHPDADRLTVCEVDTGAETVQVVCGAPNAREGLVTAFVAPGRANSRAIDFARSQHTAIESISPLFSKSTPITPRVWHCIL